MKALVTGGAGFVGSNLVDLLIEKGHEVTVIDDLSTGFVENVNLKASYVAADINDEFFFPNIDVCFHLAGFARIQPSFERPMDAFETNVKGTMNVLESLRKTNPDVKFIYAGTSSYYHDPYAQPYTFTKWQGEEACLLYNKAYGISVAIARFFNVYGPRQIEDGAFATVVGIFEKQKRNNQNLTVTGDGQKRRDFTHVRDICEGLLAMSEKRWNGEVFNLGTGVNHSIKEVADMFEPVAVDWLPNRDGEAQETKADLEFTLKNLNWKPQKDLQNYVIDFMNEHFLVHKYNEKEHLDRIEEKSEKSEKSETAHFTYQMKFSPQIRISKKNPSNAE
jgi:UDP-glucose 4-epimerase